LDPFLDAPPTQAKLPRDLTYLHAIGSHLLDRLKQFQFLLPPLPGNFHLLRQDAGSDSDRLGSILHFLLCWRWRQGRCARPRNLKVSPIDSKVTFHRLNEVQNQVKTIGYLDCFGCAETGTLGIDSLAIAADSCYFWMLCKPLDERVS
jgi:hypothetical protein